MAANHLSWQAPPQECGSSGWTNPLRSEGTYRVAHCLSKYCAERLTSRTFAGEKEILTAHEEMRRLFSSVALRIQRQR